MVLYDGNMSNDPNYNFCYLCKERLDTYHDDQDEGWYFVNTKQIRINKDPSSEDFKSEDDKQIVNVHVTCLKEIELSSRQSNALGLASSAVSAVRPQQVAVEEPSQAAPTTQQVENGDAPLAGQRRSHIEYQRETEDAFVGLQGFISGMESQKSKRQCTSSGGFMWSQSQ